MTPLDALYRCQRAWERSQPQTFFELVDAGLDETHGRSCEAGPRSGHGSLGLVEPADFHPGGLNPGAEPHSDLLGTDGESFPFRVASRVALPRAREASAPSTTTGPGRMSLRDVRGRGQ